jgi:UDP-N-acetylglucosamine acyltransferase
MIHPTAKIHPAAIVDESVSIGANVTVGPFSYITGNVVIGDDNEIMSHVVIKGNSRIGNGNQIFPFALIGEKNQDKKYQGEDTRVIIGDHNVIRESVQIHSGTIQDKQETVVGNHNLLCVGAHIAHDIIIGDHVHIGNNTVLGGHVMVEDHAGVMALSAVHPGCVIGAYSYTGGCSGVAQDVPPYVLVAGSRAEPFGLNLVGLMRNGFERAELRVLKRAYKEIYRSGKSQAEILESLDEMAIEWPSVARFANALRTSVRGIIR